jgi:hypothetical protein
MKIRRFNEQAENMDLSNSRFIEKDGEIWISKKDVVKMINNVVIGLKNDEGNNDREVTLRRGSIMEIIINVIKVIKNGVNEIGGKEINPLDPYDEEDWD